MKLNKPVLLEFNQELNNIGDKKLSDGLSAVVRIGHELWVANDESTSLERLSQLNNDIEDTLIYSAHVQFPVGNYISLPVASKNDEGKMAEIDIEGLDFKDGYLWLVGSHSTKRKKPDEDKTAEKKFRQLAKVSSDGNRYLLARIPLVEKEGTYTPAKETYHNGTRMTAAQLPGNSTGNDLTKALAEDIHLKDFFNLPGKDNGFDIEGLAAGNNGRIFIGLRGPVLRGYAVIIELQPDTNSDSPLELRMMTINPNNPDASTYRKHILDLGGLGIRELSIDGPDMLILGGPTMNLDGPVTIFRWKDYKKEDTECFVSKNALEEIMQIPYGKGEDHAEGMTRFSKEHDKASALLLVYDAASKQSQKGEHTLKAEIFELDD